jgi:site-specific recombinase XerD
MAGLFYQLREKKAKTHQIIYLAYKFDKLTFRFNTGVKILPKDWSFEKSIPINRAEPLDIQFTILKHPFIDISNKTSNHIEKGLNDLKTKAYDFISHNPQTFNESNFREYLNGLFVENDGELGLLSNEINDYIRLKLLKDARAKKTKPSKAEFIEKIEAFLLKQKSTESLMKYIERFINDTVEGKRLNDGALHNHRSIQRYRTTQTILKEYNKWAKKEIDFENVDMKFFNDFNNFMTKVKDYTPATMGKHITTLKTFLKEATEAGLNTNLKYQSKAFKAFETESESIALTPNEIEALYKLDLTNNERLDRVRDAFVLGCWSGLRWSDFTDIKPKDIKKVSGGYNIDIIQEKTKNQVIIPANNIVMEILDKYNRQLPEPISNQKFNDYLKEVARMVESLHITETMVITKGGRTYEETKPRWQMVSSHTARRSYATNAYEMGIPTLSIMAITGHKTEKSFLGYIKTDKAKHADIIRKFNK